jgi:prepilin-type processing-associated H-X9-DG protein
LKIPDERFTILLVNHDVLNGRPEMKKRAMTLVEVVLVIIVCFFIIAFFHHIKSQNEYIPRAACASNLKQINNALFLYSQDYNGTFPLIDIKEGKIIGEDRVVRNRVLNEIENAFKDIPPAEGRSVSQNLWLLVRNEFAQMELFNCPLSKHAKEKWVVRDIKDQTGGVGPQYFVDFPYKNREITISYSFVQPWSVFDKNNDAKKWFWSVDIDSRVVIGADANNGKQPNYTAESLPLREKELKRYINSTNHNYKNRGSGQNVLYGDGHVSFERSAYVGVNEDNIYTAQSKDYKGEAGQTAGVLSVRPKDQFDTVLIPNREADLQNWDRVP